MALTAGRLIVAAFALLATFAASAHVTVWPKTSRTGAYEKYAVRVPTEGKVATTSIELAIPAGADFVSIGTPIGHTYELKRSAGRVVGIVWSMQINPGEFAEFAFMARNPKDGKELVWTVVQRFADGTSVEWSEAPGTKHPASITTLSAGEDAHSH